MALGRSDSFQFIPGRKSDSDTVNKCTVIMLPWQSGRERGYMCVYTGRFIMFSVITNIYNKKIKGPTLMEFFTATGKLIFFSLHLEMFDVCTTGDTAHIHTIFKFLPHTRQNVEAYVASTSISYRCVPCHPWCTHRASLVVKKNFFSFPLAVNNSIKVGPLAFLL